MIRLQESNFGTETRTSPVVKKDDGQFPQKEAIQRFETALKAGLNTPHKPLKDKPKVRKKTKKKAKN